MARRKLPEEEVLVTEGIKLPKWAIRELERLSREWECKKSAAGRALLLFGLDLFRATKNSKIFTQYLHGQIAQGEPYIDPDELEAVADLPPRIPASEKLKVIANGAPVKATHTGRPPRKGGRK